MKPNRFPRLRNLPAALCAALLFAAGHAPAQVTWAALPAGAAPNSGGCGLLEGKLRVKVFPAYLEVEEEFTLQPQGSINPVHDDAKLRITAEFSLPSGAVVTGALVWEGARVLQARLLDKVKGDSIYEAHLDQDSIIPSRPVDPLIVERTAGNTYRLKVYPVPLNGSRRVRLRYQLPPRIGVDGFEMRLQGAIVPQFPSMAAISTSLESGSSGVSSVRLSEGGTMRPVTLPRTQFIARDWLHSGAAAATAARVLPLDPLRQVQVKTSFGSGSFQGHYLNLYGSVDPALLEGLGRRIEVVAFWKWHNPVYWKNSPSHRAEAKAQAQDLLQLHAALGGPGNGIGLLHDDSHRPQRAFVVASQGDSNYAKAKAYLESLQGDAVEAFVDSVAAAAGADAPPPIAQTRSRFLANMQIVKTLYSPNLGVVRHLILVSVGPEYTTGEFTAHAKFDSLFADRPVSVGGLRNRPFTQVDFSIARARSDHPIAGTSVAVAQTTIPGFDPMTLYATLRNAGKAYDFSIACNGGLTAACGNLEFHGKSATPWSDTVEWEAYPANGTALLGRAKTRPTVVSAAGDTSAVLLWAGSSAPFSEFREPALGPTYGFVDASTALLAMTKDSLSAPAAAAYADTGVPRGDLISHPYPGPPPATPPDPAAVKAARGDAKAWRFERVGVDALSIRVPKLAAGARVRVELVGLDGKRVAAWTLTAEAGVLRLDLSRIRAGTYLLRMRGPNLQGERLLTL